MVSKVFKTGGGAGIGSYVLVYKDHEILNLDPVRIRQEFDAGNTLYLSILDDSTNEALMPITGYVEDGTLYLSCRDFDDNKTYNILLTEDGGSKVELTDGVTIGNTTIPTESGGDIELKTINGQDIKGEGNIAITTNQPFNPEWPTTDTTAAFCEAVNDDEDAVIGMAYLGGARFSDLPFVGNGDVKVEVMQGPSAGSKSIHLVLTSGTNAPYHWEYTYWNHQTSKGWVTISSGFSTDDIHCRYYEDSDPDYQVSGIFFEATFPVGMFISYIKIISTYEFPEGVEPAGVWHDAIEYGYDIGRSETLLRFNEQWANEPFSVDMLHNVNSIRFYAYDGTEMPEEAKEAFLNATFTIDKIVFSNYQGDINHLDSWK